MHRIGEDTATLIAQQQYQQPLSALTPGQLAAVHAQTAVELKTNHYDAASATLRLTEPETSACRKQIAYWTDYFLNPERNGGLKRGLISDPTELRQFTAFITWTAWASVAIGSERSRLIEWLRLPGDLVFILFGAIPLAIASIKGWLGVHRDQTQ